MSKPNETLDCPIHGEAYTAFICPHLADDPNQEWFCDYPSAENPWPDAKCASCHTGFTEQGASNEKAGGNLNAKKICHLCYEDGHGKSAAYLMELRQAAWEPFLSDAFSELEDKQQRLETEYKIGHSDRWDYDQRHGTILFSNAGTVVVRAAAQFIGSISTTSDTWLWSWANTSLIPGTFEDLFAVRDFGEAHRFAKLTVPMWPADEVDGWEMSAVAVKLIKAKGAYRAPGKTGFTFMSLKDVHTVS
ncbi:hypothetical protein EOI86_07780 [Hwanghaeella grinnelliae]|uniref:Uncharacterized protein n=1 Tax=Hwanghaeella grinnelliae TaxID=2500179 RepID=A0A437QXE5_9PROT|nr:DUF6882 domain-containing protein [Hwanghaeella grinnelliae]RVU39139.1 hypothetical protein EOI86_07780 [Hwanghaeella grinnelliae]